MLDDSILTHESTVTFIQRIYQMMDRTSRSIGDVAFAEQALLVNAAESDGGFSLRLFQTKPAQSANSSISIDALLEKELAVRVRNRNDRRGYAIKATDKGRNRIALVDRAIALTLIDTERRLTEDLYEELVMRARTFSDAVNPRHRVTTFLPGALAGYLSAYQFAVERESAYAGLTSLQVSILCCLSGQTERCSAGHIAACTGLSVEMAELNLEHLLDRQAVRNTNGLWELRDDGRQRLSTFMERVKVRVEDIVGSFDDEQFSHAEQLAELSSYLFA